MSDAAQADASGGKGSKLVLIATLLNTVATIGVIVVLLLSFQKEKSKATVDDIVTGHVKEGSAHGEKKEAEHGGGHGEKAAHGGGHGEKAVESTASDIGKIIPLDVFTINLASGVGTNPRYLRINISLELEQGQADEEIKAKLAHIRDTVINLLNSKKASEVASAEGREVLKDEIKRSINAFMLQSKIKNVYFTNFAISN